MECYRAIKRMNCWYKPMEGSRKQKCIDPRATWVRGASPAPAQSEVHIQHLTPTKLSCPSTSAGVGSRTPLDTNPENAQVAYIKWPVDPHGQPALPQTTNSSGIYWKDPHVCGHARFRPGLLRSPVHIRATNLRWSKWSPEGREGNGWKEQKFLGAGNGLPPIWGCDNPGVCSCQYSPHIKVCTFYCMLIIL